MVMFCARGVIFLFLALLAAGGGALAEARESVFEDIYSIDLPADWEAIQIEPAYMMFASPDHKVIFLVTTGQSMPKHREKIEPLVKRYDHLRVGAPDRFASLMRIKPKRVAVTIIGDHPDRVKVYWSIKPLPGDKMKEMWGGN
jgi:hypothetical protein